MKLVVNVSAFAAFVDRVTYGGSNLTKSGSSWSIDNVSMPTRDSRRDIYIYFRYGGFIFNNFSSWSSGSGSVTIGYYTYSKKPAKTIALTGIYNFYGNQPKVTELGFTFQIAHSTDPCKVTVIADGGSATGGGEFAFQSSVEISATANSGSKFLGWTCSDGRTSADAITTFVVYEDCTWTASFEDDEPDLVTDDDPPAGELLSTEEEVSVTVGRGFGIHAVFEKDDETFSVTTSGVNGTVGGGGVYRQHEVASLIAVPDEGFMFKEWNDGMKSPIRFHAVTDDITFEAVFVPVKDATQAALDLNAASKYLHTTDVGHATGEPLMVRLRRSEHQPSFVSRREDVAQIAETVGEITCLVKAFRGMDYSPTGPWAPFANVAAFVRGKVAEAIKAGLGRAGVNVFDAGPGEADIVGGLAATRNITGESCCGYLDLDSSYATGDDAVKGVVDASDSAAGLATAVIPRLAFIDETALASWKSSPFAVDTMHEIEELARDVRLFSALSQIFDLRDKPLTRAGDIADRVETWNVVREIRYGEDVGFEYAHNDNVHTDVAAPAVVDALIRFSSEVSHATAYGDCGVNAEGIKAASRHDTLTAQSEMLYPRDDQVYEIDTGVDWQRIERFGSPVVRHMITWLHLDVDVRGGEEPKLFVSTGSMIEVGLPTYANGSFSGEANIYTQRVKVPNEYGESVRKYVAVPVEFDIERSSAGTVALRTTGEKLFAAALEAIERTGRGECAQEIVSAAANSPLGCHYVPTAEPHDGLYHEAGIASSRFTARMPSVTVSAVRVFTIFDVAPFALRGFPS